MMPITQVATIVINIYIAAMLPKNGAAVLMFIWFGVFLVAAWRESSEK